MLRSIIIAISFLATNVVLGVAGQAATINAQVHENGIGPDPDNDSNPATITGVIARINDADAAAADAPYRVINFEPPPGKHGEIIREDYARKFGVHFGRGVTRQICEGQRRFYYDSMCTYEAAPSGIFAAGYLNYLNAPLIIEFDKPVCVVTTAIYPTGGRQREPFTVTIKGWDEHGVPLPVAKAEFEWTRYTVRWRHMAGAYYIGSRAKKIAISMNSGSASQAGDVLRYLFDDLAFVQDGCDEVLSELAETNGGQSSQPSRDLSLGLGLDGDSDSDDGSWGDDDDWRDADWRDDDWRDDEWEDDDWDDERRDWRGRDRRDRDYTNISALDRY